MYNNYKSKGEYEIGIFLSKQKIYFQYETELILKRNYDNTKNTIIYPDFYIPKFKLIIEYFGIENDKEYKKRIEWKREIYKKNGYKLLELYPNDIKKNLFSSKIIKFLNNNYYNKDNFIKTNKTINNKKIINNKFIEKIITILIIITIFLLIYSIIIFNNEKNKEDINYSNEIKNNYNFNNYNYIKKSNQNFKYKNNKINKNINNITNNSNIKINKKINNNLNYKEICKNYFLKIKLNEILITKSAIYYNNVNNEDILILEKYNKIIIGKLLYNNNTKTYLLNNINYNPFFNFKFKNNKIKIKINDIIINKTNKKKYGTFFNIDKAPGGINYIGYIKKYKLEKCIINNKKINLENFNLN